MALALREKKLLILELDIKRFSSWWEAEEIAKHGSDYDDSILQNRINSYREKHTRVINELVLLKETVMVTAILEILDHVEDFQYEGTTVEAMEHQTHYNLWNIFLFLYYLLCKCSSDSSYIYDMLVAFNITRTEPGYRPNFHFFNLDFFFSGIEPNFFNVFFYCYDLINFY